MRFTDKNEHTNYHLYYYQFYYYQPILVKGFYIKKYSTNTILNLPKQGGFLFKNKHEKFSYNNYYRNYYYLSLLTSQDYIALIETFLSQNEKGFFCSEFQILEKQCS